MGATTSSRQDDKPTVDAPARGRVSRHGVDITDVEHWYDNGVYFIRSTEFDAYAEDEDFATAVDRLGETIEDLADYLGELVGSGDITENERDTFSILAPRLLESFRAEVRDFETQRRFISVRVGRHRRKRRGTARWAPRTTPDNSSQPSLV